MNATIQAQAFAFFTLCNLCIHLFLEFINSKLGGVCVIDNGNVGFPTGKLVVDLLLVLYASSFSNLTLLVLSEVVSPLDLCVFSLQPCLVDYEKANM